MIKSEIYYAVLCERAGAASDLCFNSLLDVAEHCGANGYKHIRLGYSRTDYSRNEFVKAFLNVSKHDNDTLVMLDSDHLYQPDYVSQLASHDGSIGVVGALAFRRGEPYDPLFFVRIQGALHSIAEIEIGKMYPCAIVSTSMIAIKRWVFIELQQHGWHEPYFKYEYPTSGGLPSEDMYFGRICEQIGIWHYCDSSLILPHFGQVWVDEKVHATYMANHPELVSSTKTEIPIV